MRNAAHTQASTLSHNKRHLDHIADGDLLFLADFCGQCQELRTIAHRQ